MLGRRGTAAVRDVALAGRAGACAGVRELLRGRAAWARGVGLRRGPAAWACGAFAYAGRCARAGVHGCARGAHVCVLVGVSGLQAEGYGDGFGGFDGVAVEGGGLVTPLANGVRGGGD